MSVFGRSIISATANSEFCDDKMALLGGVQESRGAENSNEIESLARFAIEEHNKKEVLFFKNWVSFASS